MSGGMIDESCEPVLPNRVLDLGQEPTQTIKLLENNFRRGHYCALSHCWGSPKKHPIRTTSNTLKDHLEGIKFKVLPRTFQDAVTVTRAIGVRYLWIDCLCIVQDDRNDWKKEAAVMGSIYERALMTIAASGAQDSTKGCFISKSSDLSSVSIPYYSGSKATSVLDCFYAHQVFDCSPSWGPLKERGWVVQEWRLSRRMVHFTEGGLSWKCKEEETDELGNHMDMQEYPDWDLMITRYSEAKFTFEADRLIALQGLATEMQKARKDRYCFGIWTADLPNQLLWMRTETCHYSEAVPNTPSWSWASKPGSKYFWDIPIDSATQYGEIRPEKISIEDSSIMKIRGVYIKRCKISRYRTGRYRVSHDDFGDVQRTIRSHGVEAIHFIHTLENAECKLFGVVALDVELGFDSYCLFAVRSLLRFLPDLAGNGPVSEEDETNPEALVCTKTLRKTDQLNEQVRS